MLADGVRYSAYRKVYCTSKCQGKDSVSYVKIAGFGITHIVKDLKIQKYPPGISYYCKNV